MLLVVMNGLSLAKILSAARIAFGELPTVVVTRDADQLPVPDGLLTVKVREFKPDPGEYLLVCNGGTSAQLVPVLIRLERSGVKYRAVEVQRDGTVELVRSLETEEDRLRAEDDRTESSGRPAPEALPRRDNFTDSRKSTLCGSV